MCSALTLPYTICHIPHYRKSIEMRHQVTLQLRFNHCTRARVTPLFQPILHLYFIFRCKYYAEYSRCHCNIGSLYSLNKSLWVSSFQFFSFFFLWSFFLSPLFPEHIFPLNLPFFCPQYPIYNMLKSLSVIPCPWDLHKCQELAYGWLLECESGSGSCLVMS